VIQGIRSHLLLESIKNHTAYLTRGGKIVLRECFTYPSDNPFMLIGGQNRAPSGFEIFVALFLVQTPVPPDIAPFHFEEL
jgi:hypothetical protein